MNATQRDIDAAIKATGRGEEWFNRALINQALDNLPGISATLGGQGTSGPGRAWHLGDQYGGTQTRKHDLRM